jgi:hypothetical protein
MFVYDFVCVRGIRFILDTLTGICIPLVYRMQNNLYHYIVHEFLNLDLPTSSTTFPPMDLWSNPRR